MGIIFERSYDTEYDNFDEVEDYTGPVEDCIQFADPGGNSALRAESSRNPRNLPCPTCGVENALTPLDVQSGYQCDACANEIERGY